MLEQEVYPGEDRLGCLTAARIVLCFALERHRRCTGVTVALFLHRFFDFQLSGGALLDNLLMVSLIFAETIQAEHGQDIHIKVIDHEADVTEAARRLNDLRLELAPKDQIDENLRDLFQSFQIDVG